MSKKVHSNALTTVAGATGYEFRMQIRRPALWIVMVVFIAWAIIQFRFVYFQTPGTLPLTQLTAGWSIMLQVIVPVAVGIMLADRLPRDRRTRVEELLETLPASPGGRLSGKYLGATLATIIPMFLTYVAVMVYVAIDRGEFMTIPLGLLSFATINVPGLLFVAAFSIACPAVLWVPLYQFLFVGYWFWGNVLSPDGPVPTISGTLLTPLGEHMANGFFGARTLYANEGSVWEGAASIALLLGFGVLILASAHAYLRWQRTRQ